jgi:molybdopterin synthase sulfur carrier subunit
MEIRVLYFASVRERLGCQEEVVSLPSAGGTLQDLLRDISARHPELVSLLPSLRFARNERFADPSEALAAGDVVALIPPVSGG